MVRRRYRYLFRRLVLGLAVASITASGAQAQSVRPDDRADRGIATAASGPVSVGTLNDRVHHGLGRGSEAPPRPDDRADRGITTQAQPVRPDDRADRSVFSGADAPVPVNSAPNRIVEATGFDWADAGIGVAAGFGFMLLAAAGVFVARRPRKSELAGGRKREATA